MSFKLGILEAGRPPGELALKYGSYPDLFRALLSPAGPNIRFSSYAVLDGVFPDSTTDCDAWLVTGSPIGVLDRQPWINPLKSFLIAAFESYVPIVGICFGHQVLAAALGGVVEKSPKGWGIGVHDYEVSNAAPWMEADTTAFSIQAVHQDQVVALPGCARVLAGSEFCPNGLVAYGATAISFQGHPEIAAPFARDIIALRRGLHIPEALADIAMADLDRPDDATKVGAWIVRFLRTATADRRDETEAAGSFDQVTLRTSTRKFSTPPRNTSPF